MLHIFQMLEELGITVTDADIVNNLGFQACAETEKNHAF